MIYQSRILAELTKSGQGNAFPQDRDAIIEVPPTAIITLSVPRPALKHTTIFSAATNVDSFKFSEDATFNASGTNPLAAIGPGLWNIQWSMSKRLSGAISDFTNVMTLDFAINDGTGASVTLAGITNGQTFQEYFFGEFVLCVPSPITYEFRRTRAAGLGTAVNRGLITIFADKLL